MGGKTFLAPITLIKFVRKSGKIDISSCYSVDLCLIIVNFHSYLTMPEASWCLALLTSIPDT